MSSRWARHLFGTLALVGMAALPASAATLEFDRITSNAPTDVAGELYVDVMEGATDEVVFHFYNTGTIDFEAAICDIYFDYYDGGSLLSATKEITNGPGVLFDWGASPPDLPGGNEIDPIFVATAILNSDSESPHTSDNGISGAEELWITFAGASFSEVLTDLLDGDLRIGLHVQRIDGCRDESDSFVNYRVPEPGTLLLFGLGSLAVAAARKQRK